MISIEISKQNSTQKLIYYLVLHETNLLFVAILCYTNQFLINFKVNYRLPLKLPTCTSHFQGYQKGVYYFLVQLHQIPMTSPTLYRTVPHFLLFKMIKNLVLDMDFLVCVELWFEFVFGCFYCSYQVKDFGNSNIQRFGLRDLLENSSQLQVVLKHVFASKFTN